MIAHWGNILTEGRFYESVREFDYLITVITNKEKYYESASMLASSIEWIMKGYEKDNTYLYSKDILVKHLEFKGDDNSVIYMCLLNDKELFDIGAEIGKDGKPMLYKTLYQLDDYFKSISSIRENNIKKLELLD
jgi:hypothetical protein